MPTYRFLDNDKGEEYEEFMSISALEIYVQEHPNHTLLINGAPMIHSGRGRSKPEEGFRDLLKDIKKKHSGGSSKSTINTF
jgi:hypothetical protein